MTVFGTRAIHPSWVPGYTRFVGWKQRISLVVLVVLTALPLSGTICAMVCDSTAKAGSGHHGSDQNCEDRAQSSTGGALIQGVSEHDCSDHDAALRQAATSAAERVLLQTHPAPLTDLPALTFSSLATSGRSFAYTGPPGAAPPPTTPLVLRI